MKLKLFLLIFVVLLLIVTLAATLVGFYYETYLRVPVFSDSSALVRIGAWKIEGTYDASSPSISTHDFSFAMVRYSELRGMSQFGDQGYSLSSRGSLFGYITQRDSLPRGEAIETHIVWCPLWFCMSVLLLLFIMPCVMLAKLRGMSKQGRAGPESK